MRMHRWLSSGVLLVLLGVTGAAQREIVDEDYLTAGVATRALYDAGVNVTFAAGNHGPAPDTLNPYAVAPWVIGVASVRTAACVARQPAADHEIFGDRQFTEDAAAFRALHHAQAHDGVVVGNQDSDHGWLASVVRREVT